MRHRCDTALSSVLHYDDDLFLCGYVTLSDSSYCIKDTIAASAEYERKMLVAGGALWLGVIDNYGLCPAQLCYSSVNLTSRTIVTLWRIIDIFWVFCVFGSIFCVFARLEHFRLATQWPLISYLAPNACNIQ